ncbi:PREDICTED: sex peptide receptor-like [Nicrophorus vespilloides]|uniref:Sex peptide receptor-like n=1 Tax=Nicrophorus vespilloides TaxID=110193 RepID=A0ABM1MFZ8_NICVS|nr:PREDICTED: sex peptide receptor-like [Nicrophorus vespilloides]
MDVSTRGNSSGDVIMNFTYCNFTDFAKTYSGIHGYLSIIVCVFGTIMNILNICVLTTKEMRWPTNLILTGLAVSDILVMLDYIPFAYYFYLNPEAKLTEGFFSYTWAIYTYFHALFTLICHFISCCLTVILAIWRYIAISHRQNNRFLQTVTSIPKTLLTIFLTYIWCPIICLPLFLTYKISTTHRSVDVDRRIISERMLANYTGPRENVSLYTVQMTGSFKNVSYLIYGVVIKLAPCILLIVLSSRLISGLMETKRRRRHLLINSGVPLIDTNGKKTLKHKKTLEEEHQTDRTTRMLVTVLLLFLVTELPQAILGLLSVIIGGSFPDQCYHPLGDLMDFLALINSSINFILYCAMSRQFRTTFQEVFRPKWLTKWSPLSQGPLEINGGATQVTIV